MFDRAANHKRYMKEVWYSKHKNTSPVKARSKVRSEVRAGRLDPVEQLACSKCGGTNNVQRHHDNHDKPLEVQVLCIVCHRESDAG